MSTTGSLAVSRRPAARVLADVVPGDRVRDLALVVAAAGLTSLLAQVAIPVPPSPVPVTGQTLAVVLVGASLGLRRGSIALALYVVAGLVLPVYSEGQSGWSVLSGPTGGYLIGFVLAAGFIGWLAERGADRRVAMAFAAFAGAQLLVFVPGLAGLELAVGETWAWTIHNGFTIFVVGGVIKAVVAALVLPSAWRLVRRADGRSSQGVPPEGGASAWPR